MYIAASDMCLLQQSPVEHYCSRPILQETKMKEDPGKMTKNPPFLLTQCGCFNTCHHFIFGRACSIERVGIT